jgi:C4-dicarboxylate-specific signal transduction histidine kinase
LGSGPFAGERLFYLLFLPLIVIAVRRGLPGAAVGIAAAQLAIVVALLIDGRTPDDAAGYQFLMLALGATTLLLGAVAGERRRTQVVLELRSAELRAQQQALADAMRVAAASEAASTLAHEMSQPLSAIGTYARAGLEMLRRGTASKDDLDNVLERIVAESARTRESVQRIREFFRTGIVRRERVEVAQLAADAEDATRDRLRAAQVNLILDIPPGAPAVDVDRVQIGTVLHNLIGNAADALDGGAPTRWIRIAARRDGAFVAIDVSDSGPGIDPAISNALFEPLATTKPTGMGLGLPICRTLVHAHGGSLDLAGLVPTTFRFTLPIHGTDDQ